MSESAMLTSDELVFFAPASWDEAFSGQVKQGPGPVTISSPPEWLVNLYGRMRQAQMDVATLAAAAKDASGEMKIDVAQLRTEYETMAAGVRWAFDVIGRKGKLEKEWTSDRFDQVARACNQFGSQVWTHIASVQSTFDKRTLALAEGKERLQASLITLQHCFEYKQWFQERWDNQVKLARRQEAERQFRDEATKRLQQETDRRLTEEAVAIEAPLSAKMNPVNKARLARSDTVDERSLLNQTLRDSAHASSASPPASPSFPPLPPSLRSSGYTPTAPPPAGGSEGRSKEVTDAFLARLLQPAPAVTTASPKKIQISKPEVFDGEQDTKFRPWWRSVRDYLAFYCSSLTGEADKTLRIGFQMKGKARTWHQARAKQLDAPHAQDTWTAYSSALEARFQDEREQENEERKMRELKYEGDIDH
ncbi:hypothetical protein FN846DRAFT_915300 [Sphaerosporella brunnea]|uniref:Retrotransposon gag domain-containing protein n=1 Tax=Sphaerosporella brunnea TaxID=1250544 RepID=A0A5J5EBH4_9PEZI|nr:hypothetical protein FN846DRAFT_915300 [Sphaerosporella brunnea]